MTDCLAEYAELHCHSYFSLLDGASSPEDLVQSAVEKGLRALALTDHDNLSGVVRFATAARRAALHAVVGAEVTLADGAHLTLLAETQAGYANLCRLITAARMEAQVEGGQAEEDEESWTRQNSARLALGGAGSPQPRPHRPERLPPRRSGSRILGGCRGGRGGRAAAAL